MTLEQLKTLDAMPTMKIDNQQENAYNQQPTGMESAEAAGAAEDTAPDPAKAYESIIDAKDEIIEAKDGIISAYEAQVESLKRQVAQLIRSGAVVTDSGEKQQDEPDPRKIRKQNYEIFSDLGKEIGR